MHRARTGRLARRLALEQLPVVCISGTGRGQAQPRMARSQTYAHSGMTVLSSGPFQKQERTGHPSRRVQPRGCCSYPPSVSLSSRGALGVPRDLLSTAHIEETVFQGRIDHSPRIAAAERRKRIAPGEARFFCARNPGILSYIVSKGGAKLRDAFGWSSASALHFRPSLLLSFRAA